MIENIIKRNGAVEPFTASKLNKWGEWSAQLLGDRGEWSSVVQEVVREHKGTVHSQKLQKSLIDKLLARRTWPSNLMAGRLYAATLRKSLYDESIPTVASLITKLAKLGLMARLNYTNKELREVETFIDHERDFEMAHFQIHQIRKKYAIQNRDTQTEYETPQFTFMRMALALAENSPKAERMVHIKHWYDEFSLNRINAPSPNYINLGTRLNGYASCCLYKNGDTVDAILAAEYLTAKMTSMSAGIGGLFDTRTLGDPVRFGQITHNGKMPYIASHGKGIKENIQAGRSGASTVYYTAFDPEGDTLARAQNPRTPSEKQNRDVHFAVLFNRLFAKKVLNNEQVFVFTSWSAPTLYPLLFSGDKDAFEAEYNRLEADDNFKKTYINARDFMLFATGQGFEVATHYEAFIDEINRHTPFREPIHSSNLCLEITEPTATYEHVTDLFYNEDYGFIEFQDTESVLIRVKYNDRVNTQRGITWAGDIQEGDIITGLPETHDVLLDGDIHLVADLVLPFEVARVTDKKVPGEVALCSLAALVVPNIKTDEQYATSAYYALKMIDVCIHKSDYPLTHVGYTAKKRMNAAVGMLGIATHMARKNLKYDSPEGYAEHHRIAERHAWYVINASLKIAGERGVAPWIHKTKWVEGWLPIDTYKKEVDEITPVVYHYDWEWLRKAIIAMGGIAHSSLIAHMPTESSSKASGAPNCLYPVRDLGLKKSDGNNVVDWVAPDSDIIADQYQLAWDIPTLNMIKVYALYQKFADHSISADEYEDRRETTTLSANYLIERFKAKVKYGIKSRYYINSLTSKKSEDQAKEEAAAGVRALTVISEISAAAARGEQVAHVEPLAAVVPGVTPLSPMTSIAKPSNLLEKAMASISQSVEASGWGDDPTASVLDFGDSSSDGRGCSGGACTL